MGKRQCCWLLKTDDTGTSPHGAKRFFQWYSMTNIAIYIINNELQYQICSINYIFDCFCAGLYEEAGASCLNTSDCYSHSEFVPRNPLLKCIDGYCLCDEDASHFVYQYLSQSYQQQIGCQSEHLYLYQIAFLPVLLQHSSSN